MTRLSTLEVVWPLLGALTVAIIAGFLALCLKAIDRESQRERERDRGVPR